MLLSGTQARFRGYLSGDALIQAYNDADCFVFPSASDTWGNVVLEAQACGLPALVTDKGGPQENIHAGETGLVYKAGSVEALTRAMTDMAELETRCAQMGQAACAYAQTRSFAESFQRFWDMIRAGDTTNPPPRPDLVRSFLKAYSSTNCGQPRIV